MRIRFFAGKSKFNLPPGIGFKTQAIAQRKKVSLEWACENGIKALPMHASPESNRKWKKGKASKGKIRYLHELGAFVLARLNGDGCVANESSVLREFGRAMSFDVSALQEQQVVLGNGRSHVKQRYMGRAARTTISVG